MRRFIIFSIVVVLGLVLLFTQDSESITNEQTATTTGSQEQNTTIKENAGLKTFIAQDIRGVTSAFSFTFTMQEEWRAYGLSEPEALNLYDPRIATSSEDTLEHSQVFITAFIANDFQTAEEVNVLSRTETTIVGRPAVTYLISPNGTDLFDTHPGWRSQTHKITQIRVSDENPSLFYTFAKRPSLADAEFKRLLNSLQL